MIGKANVGPNTTIAPMTCRNRNSARSGDKRKTSWVWPEWACPDGDGPGTPARGYPGNSGAVTRFGRPRASAGPAGPVRHEVDEDVLAEVLRRRVERPAPVEPGHQGHELRQRPRPLEHEGVDRDPLARAALDLAEGLLDRPPRRRVAELDLAVLAVGGGLAVRDHDDLAIAAVLPAEDPPRQHQP